MNEPYNLKNILKLDEFKLSVWDVQYVTEEIDNNPIEMFKKRTEISFDVK